MSQKQGSTVTSQVLSTVGGMYSGIVHDLQTKWLIPFVAVCEKVLKVCDAEVCFNLKKKVHHGPECYMYCGWLQTQVNTSSSTDQRSFCNVYKQGVWRLLWDDADNLKTLLWHDWHFKPFKKERCVGEWLFFCFFLLTCNYTGTWI